MTQHRFFWWVLAATVALAMLPYAIGTVLTPPGSLFYGNKIVAPADFSIYYSYIEQGRHGHLFMYDAFTSEAHAATLIQPLWLIFGQLANLTHLSTPAVFALGRFLAVPILVWVLWWTVRWLWPSDERRQRVGLILAIIASGFGGIITLITNPALTGNIWKFPDLWVSESFTVLTLWGSPHFILATAGILFVLVSVERSWTENNWRRTMWAGVAALAVTSIHPFHVLTWFVLWLLLTIWWWAATRRAPFEYVMRWIMVLLWTTPMLLLFALQLWLDPITIGRAAQNINRSTSVWITAVGLGLPLLGALVGIWRWRPRDERWRWVVALMAAYLLAIYLPISFQRRLGQGIELPLAWLSVPIGFIVIAQLRRRSRWLARGLAGLTIVALSSTWLIVLFVITKDYVRDVTVPDHMYFIPPAYQRLAAAVKTTNPHQPLLGTLLEGNILAGLTSHQVYVGYGVETLNYDQKFTQMKAFYGQMTPTEQRDLLSRERLCYVIDSPRTRAYGAAFQPGQWNDLRLRWSEFGVSLYQTPYCR